MNTFDNSFFPMFVSIESKKIKIFGAGKISYRRICTLLDFKADITVVSPEASFDIIMLAENNKITYEKREYYKGECSGFFIVIAATNDKDINSSIYDECKRNNIIVNIADCKEKCDFYFPAVIKKDDIVIGITSGGNNHSYVKKAADRIRSLKSFIFEEGEHS